MENLIEQYEAKQITNLLQNKTIPDFRAGDTVSVSVRVIDGTTERLQVYEGVVIAKRNRGMIYSPVVNKIEVVKRGVVRRAKLFYLRGLSGKAGRIKEKISYTKKK